MEQIQNWVSGALAGDPARFDRLVAALRGKAVAVAYSRLHDYHLAQDAAQMAFVVAFQNLSRLRDPAAFSAWRRRITVSQCHRIARRRRLQEASLTGEDRLTAMGLPPRLLGQRCERRAATLVRRAHLVRYRRVGVDDCHGDRRHVQAERCHACLDPGGERLRDLGEP